MQYLGKAIDSALIQNECKEIILIEDASQDDSLKICQNYQQKEKRIKLLRNQDNNGPAYSRNLGIKNASCPFISFLDSDDYYLPNRFQWTKEIFKNQQDADGVYEGIGTHYYREELKQKHLDRVGKEKTMIERTTSPEDLFFRLIEGKIGHFSIDGLTIKKEIMEDSDLFDESLHLGEDTDFIWNLALKYRLYGGDIDSIVAMRGVHGLNSVFVNRNNIYFEKRLYNKWIKRALQPEISKNAAKLILRNSYNNFAIHKKNKSSTFFIDKTIELLKIIVKYPRLAIKVII